ncbi:MAG: amidophosphoribosyltransferase [Candidatus Woesearchaeota archaeon]|nr:amidophosphoribosyltransferase [Candidatus Woesearchaeota archaeon]
MGDGVRENCGIFGCFGVHEASNKAFWAGWALQHRGEESAGIVSSDGNELYSRIRMGLIATPGNFDRDILIETLPGNSAISHTRYSTMGNSTLKNAQPIIVDGKHKMAIAHNGTLVDTDKTRINLITEGVVFSSETDSELIAQKFARSSKDSLDERVYDCLDGIRGAFSLAILTKDALIGVRDGFRPLVIGKLGEGICIASETCALDAIKADYVRDVRPGEFIVVNNESLKTQDKFYSFDLGFQNPFCIFEEVYFARPDSIINGVFVNELRFEFGRSLARSCPAKADIVAAILDSGYHAALGFSEESKIPYKDVYVRNHYTGRGFINPRQSERESVNSIKLNIMRNAVKDKRIILVDDSIVRGNTTQGRINDLKAAGAKEVHLRISCPPHEYPCFYGIDFPTQNELAFNKFGKSIENIREFLGADSLCYLPLDDMLNVAQKTGYKHCAACWNGNYPVK